MLGADIEAAAAWDITTGKPEVVIAIIDTGVDIDHPELNWQSGKIFLNPGEIGNGRETNGIDDDGNGYVDDWRGWDFYSHDNDPRPGQIPMRDPAHGTSCAGIAAAQGNDGQGIAGVAYGCRILPIKIFADNGVNYAESFYLGSAIRYAASYADVLSGSWGTGDAEDSAIASAIDYATISGRNGKGCPALFATGNFASAWKVERFPFTVASGSYALSFYFQKGTTPVEGQYVAVDNIALLGSDEYTYQNQILPKADFESGTIPSDWSVHKGGGATQDWLTTSTFQQYHGTPSAWCLVTPFSPELPFGGWVEIRSTNLTLSGSYTVRFANYSNFYLDSQYQVRLLNTQGQVVQTIATMQWSSAGSSDTVKFPAKYVNSIAIGAITDTDRYPNYSCYRRDSETLVTGLFCVGPSNEGWNDMTTLDIAGPNGDNGGNTRFRFGGTSAATPCVAGIAALMLSKNSELTWQQAKTALQSGCEQVGDETYTGGKALHYGYGRANAFRSVSTYTAIDTTQPWVSSVVTKTGRQIEVTFSEKMGSGVTTPGYYSIGGAGKGTLPNNPSTVTWVSGYKYLLEWTSGEMIAGTGNIAITVQPQVKDVAGNSIGSPNFGFANGSRVIHAISCGEVLPNATDPIYPFESERNYWSGAGLKYGLQAVATVVNNDGTPMAFT